MAKILVIDYRESDRKRLCEILSADSHTLLEAGDSEKGAEICANELPDLIIADDAMPLKDDIHLCTEHLKGKKIEHIPVILLSGWAIPTSTRKEPDIVVADFINRPINENEVLARVRSQLRLHELAKSVETINEQFLMNRRGMEESLKSAALIQKSLLPISPPAVDSFAFAWRFMPSENIGGDLFNVFRLDESHLAAYILDVSGKGVPAAMVTASVAQTLSPYLGYFLKRSTSHPPYYELVAPAEVLANLNREYPIERFDKFFTLCYLIVNTKNGVVRYSNAAHPLPLHLTSEGRIEPLWEGGPIIGLGECARYDEGEIVMRPGERLFLFTDGILEHTDADGEFYGDARLAEQLLASRSDPLQTACDLTVESLLDFGRYRKPEDDITLFGMEYRPSS